MDDREPQAWTLAPTCPTHRIMMDWDCEALADFCPLCDPATFAKKVRGGSA